MVKGIVFDFDGTIVDSEISRLKSLNVVLRDYNYKISDAAWNLNYRRLRSVDILEDIKKRKKFNYDSNKLYEKSHFIREELEKKGVRVVSGFFDFYNFLKKNNIKMMIASGGRIEHIRIVQAIENLPKINIIGRENYERAKPFPDCYKLALKKMNLKAEDVIVFDDSVTGMQAGIDAGCRVIGINYFDAGVDELNLYKKIRSYKDLDFDEILKL